LGIGPRHWNLTEELPEGEDIHHSSRQLQTFSQLICMKIL
jgi:hypothetical protein